MDNWNWETNEALLLLTNIEQEYHFLNRLVEQHNGAEALRDYALDMVSDVGSFLGMTPQEVSDIDFEAIIEFMRENESEEAGDLND